MKYDYIDIHSHMNISPLADDHEHAMSHLREHRVGTITVGVDYETSKSAIHLAEAEELWATVGLHPTDNESEVFDVQKYVELAKHPEVVAIGECGLDYFRKKTPEIVIAQKQLFMQHIEVARTVGKPLMIHARPSKGTMDAYEDVLNILETVNETLQEENHEPLRANFHFFVGNVEIAKRILAIGGTMSFDGPITFTTEYDEVLAFVPLESMHAETDAPFAAPAPYRGKTCEPWMVVEVVKKIALIKGLPLEKVAAQLRTNATTFFGI